MIKQLIINKLTDPGFLARVGRGGHQSGLDAKRGRAWCEYGYKEELSHDDYYNFWSRTGIGYGAVKVLVDKCWETNPIVKDVRFNSLAKESFVWHAMRKADTYRLASVGWSALLLTIGNQDDYSAPVERGGATKALVAITPVWSSAVQAQKDVDGNILRYTLKMGNGAAKEVHPSRLVIVGCPNTEEPYLRAGFNDGVNIEKILGGSGESYLKNAARQLHIDYDAEAEMEDLVKISNQDEATVREAINEVVREMNRGNDSALVTQGAKVQMLTTTVNDPTGNFDVACQSFGASVGLPIRAILGNQTGERSSSEDNKMVNQRGQSRRINELTKDVARLMRALYDAGCLSVIPDFAWDDLTEQTLTERIEGYERLTAAMVMESMLTPEQVALARKLTGLQTDDNS